MVIRPWDWNDMLVQVHGNRIQTLLNGVQMIDFTFPDPRNTDGIIALPLLPLLVVLAALDLKKLGIPAAIIDSPVISVERIIVLVALVGWTTVARIVRGATLSLKSRDFVRAAIALGATGPRVMLVHILPNLASPIIVATTLAVGETILLESVLSFLASASRRRSRAGAIC